VLPPGRVGRACLAIINVLRARGWHLSLGVAVDEALRLIGKRRTKEEKEIRAEVLEFFRARLRGVLVDDGIPVDVAEAVLSAGFADNVIAISGIGQFSRVDLSKKLARNMSLAQRPASLVALGEPSGEPAWKTIPSYYMIAGADKAIGADTEKAMAKRISPKKTITVKGASHVVMISQPKTTADFILDAAKTLK